jgi:hypothetical protein
MSAKAFLTRAVILAIVGGWIGRTAAQTPDVSGQQPPETLPVPTAPPTSPLPAIMPPPSQIPAMQAGLPPGSVPDPWITYERPGCCGPIGADGPIDSELYARTGPSIMTGPSIIRRSENTGWLSEFGARALLFNKDTTAAWIAEGGIDYSYNRGHGGDDVFPLLVPFSTTNLLGQTTSRVSPVQVSIRDYKRTAFRLEGGRDWYVGQPAYCPGSHWRIGGDIGGRWGTSRLELNDVSIPGTPTFRHVSDVYGSLVLSIHSDLEIPIGACSWFVAGVRTEWAYNWSDILRNAFPRQTSDTQDIALLLTIGVRY